MLIGGQVEYATSRGAGWRGDCFGDYGMFSSTWNHMDDSYGPAAADPVVGEAWKTAPVQFEVCGVMPGARGAPRVRGPRASIHQAIARPLARGRGAVAPLQQSGVARPQHPRFGCGPVPRYAFVRPYLEALV
jgi:hypothetical protein